MIRRQQLAGTLVIGALALAAAPGTAGAGGRSEEPGAGGGGGSGVGGGGSKPGTVVVCDWEIEEGGEG